MTYLALFWHVSYLQASLLFAATACIILFIRTFGNRRAKAAENLLALHRQMTDQLFEGADCIQVINRLCKYAVMLTDADIALICSFDRDTDALPILASYCSNGFKPASDGSVACTIGPAGYKSIKSGEIVIPDNSSADQLIPEELCSDIQSSIAAPLGALNDPSGIIILGSKRSCNWSRGHVGMLSRYGSVVIGRFADQDSVNYRLDKIRSVSDILIGVGPEAGMTEVRRTIVKAGEFALGTDLIALFAIDPFTGGFECECSDRVTNAVSDAFLQLFSHMITDRQRHNAWVLENLQEPRFADSADAAVLKQHNICAAIACPIRSEASASGALVAFYQRDIRHVSERIDIIEAIAAQASTAISYTIAIDQSKSLVDDLAGANQELSLQATVDGLTGLSNHRAFQQTLSDLCNKIARRKSGSLSLAMVDVDHFKIYNDTYGHREGDAVLQQVAKVMASGLRQGDMAARYGGEEFALIFQGTGKDAAIVAADRIRKAVSEQPYRKGVVTISVGIAEFITDGTKPSELIESADKALYHAKITGRNRVCAWGSTNPDPSVEIELETAEADMPKRTIMIIDNSDKQSINNVVKSLAEQSYLVETAGTLNNAIDKLKTRVFDITLVSNESLPNKDIRTLSNLSAIHPQMPIILMTSSLPVQESREALRRGATDVLQKPFNPSELPLIIERNMERRRLERQRLLQKNTGLMLQAIDALVAAIDAKDHFTAGHTKRVTELSLAISDELQIANEERYALELAAKLHDIGKIALPDSALNKQSLLTEDEWEIMREHPAIGAKIVGTIHELAYVSTIIRHHHERLDGSGYPDGLRGPAIPYLSRIIAVADAYEAMTSERAHRSRLSPEEAVEELKRHSGTYYSPEIIDTLAHQLTLRGRVSREHDTAAA